MKSSKLILDMERLSEPAEPYEIEIGGEDQVLHFVFTVRPLDAFDYEVAAAAARRLTDDLEKSAWTCVEAGLLPRGRIADLSKPDHRNALSDQYFRRELSVGQLLKWDGHSLGEIELTPEAARAVMETVPKHPADGRLLLGPLPLYMAVYEQLIKPQRKLDAAKEESGAVHGGASHRTPVPNIARAAESKTYPAAAGSSD